MTVKTHIVSSLVFGIVIVNFLNIFGVTFENIGVFQMYLFAVAFGATFPDIDEPHSYIGRKFPIFSNILNLFVQHRGITHTFMILFLYFLLIVVLIKNSTFQIIGIGFIIGNMGHILGDMLTKSGVAIFYPLYDKNIGLLPREIRFYTGSLFEYVVVFPVFAGILAYQLYYISCSLY